MVHNGASYVYEMGLYMADTSSIEVHIVPNKLYRNTKLLEMLGFSYNPGNASLSSRVNVVKYLKSGMSL